MLHNISLLVENRQGVLARISGLFSGRGYNLESLTVGVTADPTISRITLVCKGDDLVIDQIKKQLHRLIDIVKVTDLTAVSSVDRELALIKLAAKQSKRGEIFQIAEVFNCRVMDVGSETMIMEMTGSTLKIDDFLTLMQPYGVQEVARSGLVAMERGKKIKKL